MKQFRIMSVIHKATLSHLKYVHSFEMFYTLWDAKNIKKTLEWVDLSKVLTGPHVGDRPPHRIRRSRLKEENLFCGLTGDIIFLDSAFGLKVICRIIFVGTVCAKGRPVGSFVQIVAEECWVFINLLSRCSFSQNNRSIVVCKSAKRNMMQTNMYIKVWLSCTRSCTKV